MDLSSLTNKRQNHIQSCRENGDKSHEIIAGLYSDPSHFIYELLQNADDAGASEVRFVLNSDSLVVTHNGKRLFDFADVDSITTVGSSTKKDDINSIGTFGAGFKSVFAITKTPSIHSGNYHFRIVDFIVPETIKPKDIDREQTVTCIPFNHSTLSPEDAYKQISARLQSIESESLLFLRNIREIQWRTELQSGHYIAEINKGKATLISQFNNQDKFKDYLIFKKTIQINNTNLDLVIAYPLTDVDGETSVERVASSKLFVFFPTNERTGFQFLVHAPYKTTPSRETIPFEDSQNKIITSELAKLVADSIHTVKKNGMLTVDFLSLLPINSDNEHPLYRSAFKEVINVLAISSLLPTSNNGFVSAENALLAREKELPSLLEKMDCKNLFGREAWLSTEITNNKTKELRDYLKDILDIPEVSMEKFCNEITTEFIETKSDEWLIEFYSKLTKNKSLYRDAVGSRRGVLRGRPIIRLEDGSHINPEDDMGRIQVYLPIVGNSNFKIVKRVIVESETAKEFLASLGLEEPDEIAEIKEFIVPKYQQECIPKKDFIDDFNRVLTIWGQSNEYRQKEVSDLIKDCRFLRCCNQRNETSFESPTKSYIYFVNSQLSSWFSGNHDSGYYFLDLGFEVNEKNKVFLKSIGVLEKLRVVVGLDLDIYSKDSRYIKRINKFNPYLTIPGLECSIENIDIDKSLYLWKLLLNNYPKRFYGKTKRRNVLYNDFAISERENSSIVKVLQGMSWLYDKQGALIERPIQEIALDSLNSKYQTNHEDIDNLIKALELKLDKAKQFEKDNPGWNVVNNEEYSAFEQWKQSRDEQQSNGQDTEGQWGAEVDPDDVDIRVNNAQHKKRQQEDLSGQGNRGKPKSKESTDIITDTKKAMDLDKPKNTKAIGDWGEKLADRYLKDRYLDHKVVWLNEPGAVGKGYDFMIEKNGEEIAYYEVKSKTDESPQFFLISGTQWSWAQKLHQLNKGNMYKILLISNTGTKEAKIQEISNPVKLWNTGRLFANPVEIEL